MSKPNPRRQNGHRRDETRRRVLARDTRCWWCELPVDKKLPPRLPGSPEVHEILPVSKGGDPYSLSNCTLTHRSCNQFIGDRTPEQLVHLKRPNEQPIATGFRW